MSIASLSVVAEGGPLEAQTLALREDGTVTRNPPRVVHFSFQLCGLVFECRAGKGEVMLESILGILPYSAENQKARHALSHVILRSAGHVPGLCVKLTRDQRIALNATLAVAEPLSPQRIVGMAAKLVADSMPWINLLRPTAIP